MSLTIFDLTPERLNGVRLKDERLAPKVVEEEVKQPQPQKTEINKTEQPTLTCRTCNIDNFDSIESHHAHYKSDFHRFNLKLKLVGLATTNETQYAELISKETSESTSDDSDDSDSDNESLIESLKLSTEDDQDPKRIPRLPKIEFHSSNDNQDFEIWRTLLEDPKTRDTTDYLRELRTLNKKINWVILLCHGGHFAGAVYHKLECVKHKGFHRYTTRRKQGGSQSKKDNKSATKQPQSAGANLRRMNEKKLKQDILELLTVDWKKDIESCDFVFMYAPGDNKLLFLRDANFDSNVLSKFRSVPFTVKKPKHETIVQIHHLLTKVNMKEHSESQLTIEDIEIEPIVVEVPKEDPIIEEKVDETGEIVGKFLGIIKEGDLNKFEEALNEEIIGDPIIMSKILYHAVTLNCVAIVKYFIEKNFNLNRFVEDFRFRTVIHRAAYDGNDSMIKILLEGGSDPTLPGQVDGVYAIDMAKEKSTKMIFRRFAGKNIDMYDWNKAHIVPLTDEQEKEKKIKEAEKKKKKKKAQQEKAKLKKEEEEKEEKEKAVLAVADQVIKTRVEKMKKMNERELRADATERRLGIKANKCFACAKALSGVPFERNANEFCSVECAIQELKK